MTKHFTKKTKALLFRRRYEIGLFFISFLIHAICIPFLNVPIIVDEVNPLASLFMLKGYDWQQYMEADGYYYKYGELLFYFPCMIFRNRVLLYRAILIVNAIFLGFIPSIIYNISLLMSAAVSENKSFLFSLTVGLSPAIMLDGTLIWSEPLQMFLIWILIWQSLKLYNNKEKGHIRSSVIAFLASYAYMVHTRGIILLLSTVLIMFIIRFVWKKRQVKFMLFILITILMLIIDAKFSDSIRTFVYGQRETLIGGSTSFLSSLFIHIKTIEGFKLYITEIMGWLYSFATATLGFGVMGVLYCLRQTLNVRTCINKTLLICGLWGLLVFFTSLFMGTMFFYEDIWAYRNDVMLYRGDKLIYPRYLEISSLIMMYISLYFTIYEDEKDGNTLLFGSLMCFHSICLFFFRYIAWRINETTSWTHILMTIIYLCDISNIVRGGLYTPLNNISNGLMLFSMIGFLVFFLLVKIRRHWKPVLGILLLVFAICSLYSFVTVRYRLDKYMEDIVTTYSPILDEVMIEKEFKVLYLDDEIIRPGMQFSFPDYYIVTKRDKNRFLLNDMFILSYRDSYNTELYANDYYEISDVADTEDYHIYVKGVRLANNISNKGITLTELNMD